MDEASRTRIKEDIERNTTVAYRAPEMVDLYSGFPIWYSSI